MPSVLVILGVELGVTGVFAKLPLLAAVLPVLLFAPVGTNCFLLAMLLFEFSSESSILRFIDFESLPAVSP